MYRSAPHQWQHPAEVVPPGSLLDERSGAMRTAMSATAGGSVHSVVLEVPASLAPLTLAFVVSVSPPAASQAAGAAAKPGKKQRFVTPLSGRHFSALICCSSGSNLQQGLALLSSPPGGAGTAAAGQEAGAAAALGGSKRSSKANAQQQPLPQQPQQSQGVTVNFAVRCRGAERVCLVLLRPPAAGAAQQQWGSLEVVLDPVLNRSGELWHIAGQKG